MSAETEEGKEGRSKVTTWAEGEGKRKGCGTQGWTQGAPF